MSLFPSRTALAAALALSIAASSAAALGDPGGPRAAATVDPDAEAKATLARAHADAAAKRWEEAAKGFRDVAMKNPGTDAGRSAVRPYFDALNATVPRAGSPRVAPMEDAERDVKPLIDLYCVRGAVADHPEPCITLLLIRRDFNHLSEAPGWSVPDPSQLERWAAGDLDIWSVAGEELCRARLPECQSMAPILESAADRMQYAGRRARAVAILKILINPIYSFNKPEVIGKALFTLGDNYEAFGAFDIAATWYEQLATRIPSAQSAPRALERAVELRLKLDDPQKAREDGDLFEKTYGAKQPAGSGRVALLLADRDAREGLWKDAQKRLSGAAVGIDKGAPLDVRILAHARLGRAAVELGDTPRAAIEYGKAQRAWKDPVEGQKKISDAMESYRRVEEVLAEVLTAVGEAAFFFAEQRRAEALRIPTPAYNGPDKREAILTYFSAKASPWMKKKQAAIEKTDASYLAVLQIEPVAPPKWVIASAARVGYLWADFGDEIKRASDTPESRRKGPIPGMGGVTYEQLRAAYAGSIQSYSEPIMRRAKDAFTTCLRTSIKYHLFDETSRGCERWLSKAYPKEFHAMDELHDAPSRVSASVVPRPAVKE